MVSRFLGTFVTDALSGREHAIAENEHYEDEPVSRQGYVAPWAQSFTRVIGSGTAPA